MEGKGRVRDVAGGWEEGGGDGEGMCVEGCNVSFMVLYCGSEK